MDDELEECYGCHVTEDEEELFECECLMMCCEPCLGENCACE